MQRLPGAIVVVGLAGLLVACTGSAGQRSAVGASSRAGIRTSAQQTTDPAFAAALRVFDGVPLAAGDSCAAASPNRKRCITARSTADETQRGIAVFGVENPVDGATFDAVLARDGQREWRRWFDATALTFEQTQLPADMSVCDGGHDQAVYSAPSFQSGTVGALASATAVRAEEFVLTEPTQFAPDGSVYIHGGGFYRLSAPVVGWMSGAILYPNCRGVIIN